MHATTLHVGHLHLPVFSLFLAAGLILSLLLSQWTAPRSQVDKDSLWDALVFASVCAFFVSRILLIAANFKTFLAHPVLILTLPSVTFTGLLVTVIVLFIKLRRQSIPVPNFADAASPALALLWAVLSLGIFITGSDGAPASIPWAISDSRLGPIHPVELYTSAAALALCVFLCYLLSNSRTPGTTASTALFLAGGLVFYLDFLAQPAPAERIVLIDPVQWLGLAMLLTGFFALLPRLQSSHAL